MTAFERQVAGGHYQGLKIQPVQFVMANQMGFCEGNVVKYVTRWRDKGGMDDLRKARHFLDFLLEGKEYRGEMQEHRGPALSRHWWEVITAEEYIAANRIENPEAGVIRAVWAWNVGGVLSNLHSAVKWLDELIGAEVEQ